MFLQDAVLQADPVQAEQILTAAQIAWNGLATVLIAMLTMYAVAYRRIGSDDFVFWPWFKSNKNRWINGVVTLLAFYFLVWIVPDVTDLISNVGFNLNPKLPVASGLALAAWLTLSTKAKDPTVPPSVSPIP